MELVQVAEWAQWRWLRHGFSTRVGGCSQVYGGGDLNLGFTKEDDPECVVRNRALFLEAVGGGEELATVRQVHGAALAMVKRGGAPGEADGLITAEPGVMLGVFTADCVPVLVADVRLRVVAGFHAGWRGTAAGIASLGVARMVEAFGCAPQDLVAAVGPSIGPCCFQIGEELRDRFPAELFRGDRLDLWEANRQQLRAAGIERITVIGECSACKLAAGRRKYFSHRLERGLTGRGMGVIGVASTE